MDKLDNPFTIVYDTREQTPFVFDDIFRTVKKNKVPIIVPTVCQTLNAGDYSIAGMESLVSIERKSVQDLVGTIFQSRDRFERELVRLDEKQYAAVLVEGSWSAVMTYCRTNTRGNPDSVQASILAWDQRFKTRWWFAPSRSDAAKLCFFMLERFYKDRIKNEKLL